MPGGSVHTLGMRFAIDVVFLNRQMQYWDWQRTAPPWRILIAPMVQARVSGARGR